MNIINDSNAIIRQRIIAIDGEIRGLSPLFPIEALV